MLHDRLKMWFDEWLLKPSDSIPAKIQEGLEFSHVLVLCMSTGKHNIRLTEKRSGITDIGGRSHDHFH